MYIQLKPQSRSGLTLRRHGEPTSRVKKHKTTKRGIEIWKPIERRHLSKLGEEWERGKIVREEKGEGREGKGRKGEDREGERKKEKGKRERGRGRSGRKEERGEGERGENSGEKGREGEIERGRKREREKEREGEGGEEDSILN